MKTLTLRDEFKFDLSKKSKFYSKKRLETIPLDLKPQVSVCNRTY